LIENSKDPKSLSIIKSQTLSVSSLKQESNSIENLKVPKRLTINEYKELI